MEYPRMFQPPSPLAAPPWQRPKHWTPQSVLAAAVAWDLRPQMWDRWHQERWKMMKNGERMGKRRMVDHWWSWTHRNIGESWRPTLLPLTPQVVLQTEEPDALLLAEAACTRLACCCVPFTNVLYSWSIDCSISSPNNHLQRHLEASRITEYWPSNTMKTFKRALYIIVLWGIRPGSQCAKWPPFFEESRVIAVKLILVESSASGLWPWWPHLKSNLIESNRNRKKTRPKPNKW